MSAENIKNIIIYAIQCNPQLEDLRELTLFLLNGSDNIEVFRNFVFRVSNSLLALLHNAGFFGEDCRLLDIACEVVEFRKAFNHEEEDVRGLIARMVDDNNGK